VPIGIKEVRQDWRRLDHRALGQTVERGLGEQPPRLRPRQPSVELVGLPQRDPPMLAAMSQPHEPVAIAARPDAQAEARQLGIPDAIITLAQLVLAPREISIEQCPAPGLSPPGDHMAIVVSRTARESPGIATIFGDRMAIASTPAAERFQHLAH